MAASTVVKVPRDGRIVLSDNGGSNVYSISYENGDFGFDNLTEQADRIIVRDRGSIVGLRRGDDPVGSLSFTVHMRDFAGTGSDVTLLDAITGTGTAASWVSVGGDAFDMYLLDVIFEVEGSDHNDTGDHKATFSKVLLTASFSEGSPNSISVSGEVYGGIAYVQA
jgi:hypothetical protein